MQIAKLPSRKRKEKVCEAQILEVLKNAFRKQNIVFCFSIEDEVKLMKRLNLKKLVLSAAIVGAGTFAMSAGAESSINSESSINRDTISRDAQSQSVTVPGQADRNITNPNTPEYSNRNVTESGAIEAGEARTLAAEVDGTVHFEPNSVTLTESAERQLKQVVDQLDKGKPVALTVELQGTYNDGTGVSSQSSSAIGQDSSAGLPMDERGLAGGGVSPAERSGMPGNAATPSNNAEAIERENADRAQLVSRYRAENIRQYMERQGIEVVEWNMESNDISGSGDSADTGYATSNPSARQSAEEVQQVRIVVVGDVQPEGLSAL